MASFDYIAILGRQPELGLVELESLLGPEAVCPFGRSAALLGVQVDVGRLGGCVKTGRVIYRGKVAGLRELPVRIADLVSSDRAGKLVFGLSVYGGRVNAREVMAAGLEYKKQLRTTGRSVRLVSPGKGTVLSAAELKHNHVVGQGFELLVVVADGEMVLAVTTDVQDVGWYARRDYGRPARSAKVGMLPPKLAQVLVNTVAASSVMDPFCGTGVVLQEARLLGRSVTGSDLSPEMVSASEENMHWLEAEVIMHDVVGDSAKDALPEWSVILADAREVGLPSDCAVVSEGYLGPNLTHSPTPDELGRIRSELLKLYQESLCNFARQQVSGAEVSICVPAWRVGKRWEYLGLVDELAHLGYTLKGYKHVRTPLLYAREDQVVGRQLLLLRKK